MKKLAFWFWFITNHRYMSQGTASMLLSAYRSTQSREREDW
jgi:hypothetical protein